jgi:hypothetical protein
MNSARKLLDERKQDKEQWLQNQSLTNEDNLNNMRRKTSRTFRNKKRELFTPSCRTLFEKLIVTQPVKKYHAFFMEPEGSLPCSQKLAIGPYPEPAESGSPHRSLSP